MMAAERAAVAISQAVGAFTARTGVAALGSGGPSGAFFFDRGVGTGSVGRRTEVRVVVPRDVGRNRIQLADDAIDFGRYIAPLVDERFGSAVIALRLQEAQLARERH